MKSFKTFINETNGVDLSKVHAILAQPVRHVKEERLQLARDAAKKLEHAIAAKSIWNADFTDIKDRLARVLEYAYDEAKDREYFPPLQALDPNDNAKRMAFFDTYEAPGMSGLQSAKKNAAHWAKHHDKFPGLARVSAAQLALKDALDAIKPFIQKGRAPKPVDPNKFVKPTANYDVRKEVAGWVTSSAEQLRRDLHDQIHTRLLKQANDLKRLDGSTYQQLKKGVPASAGLLAQRLFKADGYRVDSPHRFLEQDVASVVGKFADDQTNDLINFYIAKNTDKLALLVQKKGHPAEHKIITNRVNNGVIENKQRFGWADGSGFDIYTQVEYATSPRGVYFMRMPTRFANVTMADGTKMARPTEEKMIKEFN